ncbi:antibiotic biosynthesis monooxygenase [Jatrophihabitans sp. GAS493]|uniref:antibiotic biosynthesis monooxygenase family protein n=1 Tax=Jatrophihabitans sp. GAS493 TaxID=1907575 RepID=UPI000BB9256B|nr:antibiotic biosynthesis monooxygenase [Jatrophihabitans sp. GAS493]SOD74699.1 antibiotic biosynthesis monooxygenase [Jatrophihabitans sp. GAS493]
MISVTHFDAGDDLSFAERAQAALAALAARPGYLGGSLGRSTDDDGQWIIVTEWADVGSYRRALGGFEVKMLATPLLAQAIDQPSSFEQLVLIDADQQVTLRRSDRA